MFVLIAATAGAATDLLAQFPGGGPPGGEFPDRGPSGGGMRGAGRGRPDGMPGDLRRPVMPENLEGRIETRLAQLHEDLGLSAAQENLWNAYADRIMSFADDMSRDRVGGRTDPAQKSLEKIKRAVDAARNRLAALEDIESTAKALYGSFTPEQKTVADPRLASLIPMSPATDLPDISERPLGSTERFGRQKNSR